MLTGAGGGLGGYIARSLAAEGANVVLSDMPGMPLDDLVDQLRATGSRAETVAADLADTAALEELVAEAEQAIGPLDILVNNAGLEFVGSFGAQTREQLEAITKVNLLAVMELTRVALLGMRERGRGHVVNMASVAGRVALSYYHTYNATKHGVVGFTHALRGELTGSGVSASVICPGFISRMGMYGRVEDQVKVPAALGRMPPESVGDAVVRAIRDDVPEVVVTSRPTRPFFSLAAAFPGLMLRINRFLGADETAYRFAEAAGRNQAAAPRRLGGDQIGLPGIGDPGACDADEDRRARRVRTLTRMHRDLARQAVALAAIARRA